MLALALAASSATLCEPGAVATAPASACSVALGIADWARLRAIWAGALGESASPGAASCVACVRRAAPEATRAGLSPPGVARSIFGELPTPAVPPIARVNAILDGCAASLALLEDATAEAGLSTLAGDVAAGAAIVDRDGVPLAASCGFSVGTALACARAEPAAAAIVVVLLADGAANVGWVMLAAALLGAV
jgi:hypothetical protein